MTTAIARSNRLYAEDKGRGATEDSFSQENSYERKHRDMSWEMKRQAREKRVKELEQNLKEMKTQSKSRMDNPFYDNSYLTNVKAVQNKASDYLKEAYTQVGEIQTISSVDPYESVKAYREPVYTSQIPPDQRTNLIANQNQLHKHSHSTNPVREPYSTDTYRETPRASARKIEQRYQEDSPPERVDNPSYQVRTERDNNQAFKPSPVINKPLYKPSEDFAKMFKEDFPNKNNSGFRWDNNTRGQKLKQEYNLYVNQEMEKDRIVNPRLKRRSKERYEGDDSSSAETRRRLAYPDSLVGKSLPNLQLIQPQGKPQAKQSPVLKKAAKQEAYANDLIDQIKQKEQEKQQRKYQKILEDRQALEQAEIYFPFGKPGAGAPLTDEYGEVNARRNRDAYNAIYNTDTYSTYNNYQNMNPSTLSSPNRVNYQQVAYQNSRLANYGNQILDRGAGNYEASTDYNSTNDSTDRRNLLNASPNPGAFTDRNTQRKGEDLTHQVPGMGLGYNHRDQQFWQKKQRIAEDLARVYQEQMADKQRRELEEKIRKDAEERAIEEKVKKELKEMAMAYQAEKEVNRAEQSYSNKSFEKLKEEYEVDNQGKKVRKKGPVINLKPSLLGSKRDLDAQEKAASASHSQHQSMIRDHGNTEQEENPVKSRILNESLLDQQKPGEKSSGAINVKLGVIADNKPSPFYHKQYRVDYYPDGTEMPVSFKTAADEQLYRLKKEVATRTSLLQEQATFLKTDALTADTIKQDAIRELIKLKEQLKQERGLEDYRAREMYEYLSKSSVNNLSQKHDNLRNLDKPLDYPMRPRNYAKIFELKDDYEDYYSRMRSQLDDVSQFVPLRDSNKIATYLRAQPNPNKQNKTPTVQEDEGPHQQTIPSKGDLTNRSNQLQQNDAKINGSKEDGSIEHEQRDPGHSIAQEHQNTNAQNDGTNKDQNGQGSQNADSKSQNLAKLDAHDTNSQHQYQTQNPQSFGQQPNQYDTNHSNHADNQGHFGSQQQINPADPKNMAVQQGIAQTNSQAQNDDSKSKKPKEKDSKEKKPKLKAPKK